MPQQTQAIAIPVDAATSGDNEVAAAPPAGWAWLPLGWSLTAAEAVVATLKSGANAFSTIPFGAGITPAVCPPSADWGFPLRAGKALTMNLSAGKRVAGHVTARLVPFPHYARPVLLVDGEQLTFDFENLIYE